MTTIQQVDVLIVGAGISGIGAAYHLKTHRPGDSFVVLDAQDAIGGTWNLFQYPGIRSDSDMPTFGYGFRPWTHRQAIADGHLILDYLRQVVTDSALAPHIRFGRRVLSAEFDSNSGRWVATAQHTGTGEVERFSARFLFSGTGYYDYDAGYTPEFKGEENFRGDVIHPQHWPTGLDYSGKRVIVIGSGATAVTLIPAMSGAAAHVTMLQRSPSYVASIPASDPFANVANRLLGHGRAHRVIRRKNIALSRGVYKACVRAPWLMRKLLIANVRRQLPKGFDVDTHFSPRYSPWEQRLCMVPDGDLFKSISSGRASVVTDRIERFTERGILLKSGQELIADIIVTATGLNMSPMGKVRYAVDESPVNLADTTTFKSMMLSGVPNFVFAAGYTNLSWTLKVDLVCEHFCRLLDHMDCHGYGVVTPVLDGRPIGRGPFMDLSAGYVQRGIAQFPKAGDRGPWTVAHAYESDVERLRHGPIEDVALRFAPVTSAQPQP
ncbi:flavin-containing monooxygenase [Mycobacteroides immunogenum]|uniref:FAD-containing monooxygenase EthA n=1 Tax=Mycobacteroides immunogenum TaxID=83262 RepID=A0A7V8LTP4_9MYCO|nr:NAD(P)/FAD-dependent oxidoreductase [Mycobacteroides immunogenum]AMT73264.1 FAD-containing monooxygenase EthA [Mycobacteroides immunogenum]ANO06425.1 FAD-containing monooxygenase EthA [Mycobacteroides immunogenum]KIU39771.1 FAD-containing monooxygenase EthA [Mycobacteroides immunogenum]KPG10659.1 FAD-containing monooxygenase EthA [Mycobacteroides immunogenum]KPG12796.1 FAD-containing monooxygenase EthA [Mycobacteroides immunogenum]